MPSRLSRADALLLGAVQGPTEVLPVSSSAHIALLRRALGKGGETVEDSELYDALEVALHAGAALALLIAGRRELARAVREASPRRTAVGVLSAAPAALAGGLLELSPGARNPGPRTIAAGLALGGVALALADRRPEARGLAGVGLRDGVALGAAQALALLPGVSRNGATLTAARARRFTRVEAQTLSWQAGLPVLVGATALRCARLGRGRTSPGSKTALLVGSGAAFCSTLASVPLLRLSRSGNVLRLCAIYRCGLALAALKRPAGSERNECC